MKTKKNYTFISLMMVLVLAFSFIGMQLFASKQELSIRTIDVDEIGTLSYEEKVEKLKEQFDYISTKEDDRAYYFCAEIDIDTLNLTSTNYEGEVVKEKYFSSIDKNDESIAIEKDVIINNEVVGNVSSLYTTKYDEETDTYYIIDENGVEIDVFSQLDDENMNDCFALTAFLFSLTIKQIVAVCVVSAISVAVIVNADKIASGVNQLVDGVRDGHKSFWEKIKLRLGKITAIKLSTEVLMTASVALEVYEVAKNRKDCYLLCGAITGSGFIPIQYKFTNYENARNWIKKGGSVWSPYSTTAEKCIEGAGYIPMIEKAGMPFVYEAERHSISFKIDGSDINYGFYHYHAGNRKSLNKIKLVHSFFGLPFDN